MDVALARHVDLDAAVSVWHKANIARGKPPSSERIARVREKLTEAESLTYIATEVEVVAMLLIEPYRAEDGAGAVVPGQLHISMCFVHPAFQRRGIGRALVTKVIETARTDGALGLSLWTSSQNIGAKTLYESLGMNRTQTRQVSDAVQWVRFELVLN